MADYGCTPRLTYRIRKGNSEGLFGCYPRESSHGPSTTSLCGHTRLEPVQLQNHGTCPASLSFSLLTDLCTLFSPTQTPRLVLVARRMARQTPSPDPPVLKFGMWMAGNLSLANALSAPSFDCSRRAAGSQASKPNSTRAAGAGGSSGTMLKLYTDDSPGLRVYVLLFSEHDGVRADDFLPVTLMSSSFFRSLSLAPSFSYTSPLKLYGRSPSNGFLCLLRCFTTWHELLRMYGS